MDEQLTVNRPVRISPSRAGPAPVMPEFWTPPPEPEVYVEPVEPFPYIPLRDPATWHKRRLHQIVAETPELVPASVVEIVIVPLRDPATWSRPRHGIR